MKRKLLSLLLCLSMAFALTVPAFAATYEDAAESLKSIGLFRGTDKGFELDRPATRIEAAVMLVRLLGQEDAANARYAAKEISHPFTDVPSWADAHIALLYTDGIAKGSGGTIFGTSECTAQMYCTFLLRALGYTEEAGDFTYDRAVEKATALGFYDEVYFGNLFTGGGVFLRDDVVAVSYLALGTDVKDTEKTLLAKLCDDGAVDAKAAEKMLTLQDELREFNELVASAEYDTLSAMGMDIALNVTLSGIPDVPYNSTLTGDVEALFNFDGDDIEASITYALSLDGQTEKLQAWFKDGYIYAEMDGEKIKIPYDMSELLALAEEAEAMQTSTGGESFPALFVKEFTEKSDGTYELILSDALMAPIYEILDLITVMVAEEGLVLDLQFNDMTYRFNRNGVPKEMSFAMSLLAAAEGESIKADAVISAEFYTDGKTVRISFPSDLRDFQEVEVDF